VGARLAGDGARSGPGNIGVDAKNWGRFAPPRDTRPLLHGIMAGGVVASQETPGYSPAHCSLPEDLFMPASPSTTSFAIAPVAGMVVRGCQQPAMISHYPPPPVSGVVGGVAPPACVVVLG